MRSVNPSGQNQRQPAREIAYREMLMPFADLWQGGATLLHLEPTLTLVQPFTAGVSVNLHGAISHLRAELGHIDLSVSPREALGRQRPQKILRDDTGMAQRLRVLLHGLFGTVTRRGYLAEQRAHLSVMGNLQAQMLAAVVASLQQFAAVDDTSTPAAPNLMPVDDLRRHQVRAAAAAAAASTVGRVIAPQAEKRHIAQPSGTGLGFQGTIELSLAAGLHQVFRPFSQNRRISRIDAEVNFCSYQFQVV